MSLGTDSPEAARQKAEMVWRDYLTAWEALLSGNAQAANDKFARAKRIAESRGFRWLPMDEVKALPAAQLLDRIEAVKVDEKVVSPHRAEAILGGVERPGLTVSAALEDFWRLAADRTHEKSPDQVRRWKNPRVKAVTNFIDVIGDVALKDITANDMLDFREWWWDRIENEGLTANSANKDFTHLGNILKTVCEKRRLGFIPPVSGLSFKEGRSKHRPPYSTDFIRDKLIRSPDLMKLNPEARTILLGMVNTGYRPSEGAALLPQHIRLDGPIPYISIEAEGRALKTERSEREIPLVGVSLEAFRDMPGGTPRYRDKPGLSATLNKFLRENDLAPTADHTVYCLRHSFEDRLLVAGVDERVRRDLMGHRLSREQYGLGGGLELRFKAVQLIAL